MNANWIYPVSVIFVLMAVTYGLRALPFLIFGSRPLPKAVKYLGDVLPPAIMTILVIYCLRNTEFRAFPFGIPEISASLLVVILQHTRKNMYLSIVVGTIYYMFILRMF